MATDILNAPGVAPAADPLPVEYRDIPIVRKSPDRGTVSANLGHLAELAGSWRGMGFNLIARPDFHNKQNLYLQLSQTLETLQVDPIGSGIPNRGFGQDDIQLFGLTYMQKISDLFTGGALHIEPGIWVTQPPTTYPAESSPANTQIIARMGSIPHGNALLAQGTASAFSGAPVLKSSVPYNGSVFPSFNSTPFGANAPVILNAAGTSEKANATANGVPPFNEYDLTVLASATNPRTPFATAPAEPPLPAAINGVPMQTVVNDPITLLQAVISQQVKEGFTFEGTVLNISTQKSLSFFKNPNAKAADPNVVTVSPIDAAGGIENMPFLEGGEPTGSQGPNADTVTVYATFWLEKVSHPSFPTFLQLQYAQMVVLNYPIFTALHPPVTVPPTPPRVIVLGWPHISVATLTKCFN